MRKVRTLRHWKQRYDKNAAFIFRRPTVYAGKLYQSGSKIPKQLADHKVKLRRFWESKRIELAEFEAPNVVTGVVEHKPKPKRRAKPKKIKVIPEVKDKFEEDWLQDGTG